ncbi:CRISPR-associated endoribonuclease Cas6/Csy4, subtype I-F/YPEST [Tepidimonas alkaliphilus]|uniref:CRISPR-associated endoribonuclease Cas6/Csy4, subtype I-F/YPEST n=1 Tax=Tepidimonas alkaliphilus TaxID=2588942 RepID=A0A554W3W4_9BURK|nr:type I-F CRISPR-associated endoribonuclease Cas6/Csy4 [Tepidimonas alkaliphilus]TSE18253.1 CRISPR-associated endoribonuclease Cas6/Csy4, subtype I-F/YPEST [Tepidimonas alkaliphilus]
MFAQYYLDMMTRKSVEIAPGVLVSSLVQKAHPFLKETAQERRYIALAFPDMGKGFGIGKRLRWFAQQRETLEFLLDGLLGDSRFDDYWIARQIKSVPVSYDRQAAYARYRISHALSAARAARHPRADTLSDINRKMRNKRISYLQQSPAGIGYLDLRSSSTHQQFRLFVQKIDRGPDEVADGAIPDSYGLSRTSQIIPLPEFES